MSYAHKFMSLKNLFLSIYIQQYIIWVEISLYNLKYYYMVIVKSIEYILNKYIVSNIEYTLSHEMKLIGITQ